MAMTSKPKELKENSKITKNAQRLLDLINDIDCPLQQPPYISINYVQPLSPRYVLASNKDLRVGEILSTGVLDHTPKGDLDTSRG
ncbi:hypothetical protein EVAR_39301_1 [Eumeta japonica]|uniref:Uncharacterized protein n=1 Tax=Eumeta variegata TaxID=151549 RepID=A0A4C1VWS4_EUMVA|nr:hypothetical protein EVAR_39301_1 [Eumeta japonica]